MDPSGSYPNEPGSSNQMNTEQAPNANPDESSMESDMPMGTGGSGGQGGAGGKGGSSSGKAGKGGTGASGGSSGRGGSSGMK
jgi:hypothetical protein